MVDVEFDPTPSLGTGGADGTAIPCYDDYSPPPVSPWRVFLSYGMVGYGVIFSIDFYAISTIIRAYLLEYFYA